MKKRLDYFRPADIDNRQNNINMLRFKEAKSFHLIMSFIKDEIMEHTRYILNFKFSNRKRYVSFMLRKTRRKVKIVEGKKIIPLPGKPNRRVYCYNIYVSGELMAQETSQEKVIEWIKNKFEELYK